jgi:hypothetical protein
MNLLLHKTGTNLPSGEPEVIEPEDDDLVDPSQKEDQVIITDLWTTLGTDLQEELENGAD